MDTVDFLREIGRGSYATVWDCRCKATGRRFAIKKFFPSDNTSKTIERELQPLFTLRHDNLVKVFTWFFEEGLLLGVFELLDHNLTQELQRSPGGLDSDVLQKYTYQILRAVAFLHSVNIVHRDIKPDNVLVSSAGVIKLADLGFSVKADAEVDQRFLAGTLPFFPPELLLGVCPCYKPSDLWAIGCTILAMALGKVHFNRRHPESIIWDMVRLVGPLTLSQLSQFKVRSPGKKLPMPPKRTVPLAEKYGVSDPRLAEVIEGCLQMDPCKRASCAQLLRYDYYTDARFSRRFLSKLAKMVCRDLQSNRGQAWEPACIAAHPPLQVSSPEVIARRVVIRTPAVLIDSERLQDGEREERAVNEPSGFRAALQRGLASVRRHFPFVRMAGRDARLSPGRPDLD